MTVSNTKEEMDGGWALHMSDVGGCFPQTWQRIFHEKLCYAPVTEDALKRIQLCKTKIPVGRRFAYVPPTKKDQHWRPRSASLQVKVSEPLLTSKTRTRTRLLVKFATLGVWFTAVQLTQLKERMWTSTC